MILREISENHKNSDFGYAFGANPKIYYGSDLTPDQLRKIIKPTLANPHQRVMADFDRKVLNQAGSGHFSLIGTYDSKSDSMLILDVAKFKYPPFWVKTDDLLASRKTIDPDPGKSRGIVQITVE